AARLPGPAPAPRISTRSHHLRIRTTSLGAPRSNGARRSRVSRGLSSLWQTAAAMSDLIDADGFRANVGIILMRSDGTVFLGRRAGGRGWQFPQGGMRHGETLE